MRRQLQQPAGHDEDYRVYFFITVGGKELCVEQGVLHQSVAGTPP